MRLTPYGTSTWGPITAVAVVLAIVVAVLQWWLLLIPIGIAWLALASFFRDPNRKIPTNLDTGDMISPADGVVSAVERVDDHPSTGGPAVLVRIFLSVLNVHVNRAPCDGTVVDITYREGLFLDARSEESALKNESNLVTMRVPSGETIGVRQVSGKVARRIICPLKVGDELKRGQLFGMIKFGSTAEVIMPDPDSVTVHVAVGETVRGGLTTLATTQLAVVSEGVAREAVAV